MVKDQILQDVDAKETPIVKESIIGRIKLLPFMILTAIMLLICIIYNIKSYHLTVNEDIKISRQILGVLTYIPYPNILLIILVIILIYSLFIRMGIKKLIAYIISLIIVEIGMALTMSDLMLENETSFYLVNIYHTMPIQTRLDCLNIEMLHCYNNSPIIHTIVESKLIDIKNYIERSVDIIRLNEMNYRDIAYYARELFNESVQYNTLQNSNLYNVSQKIFSLLGALLTVSLLGSTKILGYIGGGQGFDALADPIKLIKELIKSW